MFLFDSENYLCNVFLARLILAAYANFFIPMYFDNEEPSTGRGFSIEPLVEEVRSLVLQESDFEYRVN